MIQGFGGGREGERPFPPSHRPFAFSLYSTVGMGSRSLCVPGALVGGCSRRKRPYPCSRRVWQAQRTLAHALAAGCNTTAFPGNRVLVLHVFLHLCSLRLVVGMCQAASVTAQLLVRRHRRAKRCAAHARSTDGSRSWRPTSGRLPRSVIAYVEAPLRRRQPTNFLEYIGGQLGGGFRARRRR